MVFQPSVADEAVNEEMDDSLEKAATTSTSLDAEQDRVTTSTTTPTISIDEATLAQALIELKHAKPKANANGIVFYEPEESTTTAIPKSKSQDNRKAKMIEKFVKLKKKDQIQLDEEVALKLHAELQAEFDKEQRIASEKAQQEELNDEEKAKLFMQLLEKRRKFYAAKRVKEKRNKPPTQAQQRKIICTYLKNIEGKKLTDLKNKSFDTIQKMFDRAFKRVNTFVNYKTELVEESSKKTKEKVTEGISERAGTKLEQDSVKKQKIDDDKEKLS
uniref:Uncharacterized protein n=1 Tax=Tanacetum cinerariifolium TaxID=118510 RepID=A0A6L2KIT5_TANCI|nr:hypothetical protein [Tanacetum cinerariifolium]